MAKRTMTRKQEADLIKEAEAARDSDSPLSIVPVRARDDATGVLSVRLPLAQIRSLRDMAVRRGVSLSALLVESMAAIAALESQRMTVSRQTSRFHVVGVGLQAAAGDGSRVQYQGDLSLTATA